MVTQLRLVAQFSHPFVNGHLLHLTGKLLVNLKNMNNVLYEYNIKN